jgi:hypothetical protein
LTVYLHGYVAVVLIQPRAEDQLLVHLILHHHSFFFSRLNQFFSEWPCPWLLQLANSKSKNKFREQFNPCPDGPMLYQIGKLLNTGLGKERNLQNIFTNHNETGDWRS